MVYVDSLGLEWTTATGPHRVIDQSRDDVGDFRWSELIRGAKAGYEVISICSFDGCNSSSHMALKHWGPNHSGSCGYSENGDCCCWYDTGIRHNGAVQTQIERSHPNNHDWTCTECTMSNIGMVMEGNTIGLRWLIFPITPNGSAVNGGIRMLMWVSTNALTNGLPTNNWTLVYDITDTATRDILDTSDWAVSGRPSYNAPLDHDIEMRISDTDSVEPYGGGLHFRLLAPSDVYGGGQGGGGGTNPACPSGQCKDPTTLLCRQIGQFETVNASGFCVAGTPPSPQQTDLKLFLSGGSTNADVKKSLGGNKSNVEVLGINTHEFMERVDSNELSSGLTDYHLLYVQNTNQTRSYNGIRIFFVHNTINPFDTVLMGLAAAGRGNNEMALAFDIDVPPDVVFTAAEDPVQGLYIPTLSPNEIYGIWFKRVVNTGSPAQQGNIAKIAIDFTASSTPTEPNNPPPDPPTSPISFTAAFIADMSCRSPFVDNWNNLTERDPDLIMCGGDLGYEAGQECWLEIVSDHRNKMVICVGNHDWTNDEAQPETRNATIEFGALPDTGYYSTVFNNVGMLVMNSEEDPELEPQRSVLQGLLEELSENDSIEWIFVLYHRPIYGTESHHPNETAVREYWHPLFDQFKVDAVLTGHNHNKYATSLLIYNDEDSDAPTVAQSGGVYSYNRALPNHGVLFWGDGAGGESHHDFEGDQEDYVEFQNDNDYGYTIIEFTNNGHTATFKSLDRDDDVLYQASITHRI